MRTWKEVKEEIYKENPDLAMVNEEVELEYQSIRIYTLINIFITKVKDKYKDLIYINFDYDSISDEYDIWHNNPELQFNNSEFKEFAGKLINEYFYSNNIYNICFGYDYLKSQNIKEV